MSVHLRAEKLRLRGASSKFSSLSRWSAAGSRHDDVIDRLRWLTELGGLVMVKFAQTEDSRDDVEVGVVATLHRRLHHLLLFLSLRLNGGCGIHRATTDGGLPV